jgi:hypothetical protein
MILLSKKKKTSESSSEAGSSHINESKQKKSGHVRKRPEWQTVKFPNFGTQRFFTRTTWSMFDIVYNKQSTVLYFSSASGSRVLYEYTRSHSGTVLGEKTRTRLGNA